MAEKTKFIKAAEFFHEHAGASGKFVNGAVVFIDNLLGNIGKLLSTGIIIFTAIIIWYGFWGQVRSVRDLPVTELKSMSQQEQLAYFEERRGAYKGALESASAPLATLVGVVTIMVGVGLTLQKWKKGGTPEQPDQQQVAEVMPIQVSNLPTPANPVITQVLTQEDGNKTIISY